MGCGCNQHQHLSTRTRELRAGGGLVSWMAAAAAVLCCLVDVKKAFPSVFKAGLLYKLHQMGVNGRYWRMISNMYEKIKTRIHTHRE